jgi:Zn finger protein HypA/HybF involved in hydrogenase expression
MITIECSWCDTELLLDGLDAATVDCPVCRITVEIAADPDPLAIAA